MLTSTRPPCRPIDAQSVRAAVTVPAASCGYDGGKKVPGRKRHIATDTLGPLLAVAVTAANIGDRDVASGLLMRLRRLCAVAVWPIAIDVGEVPSRRLTETGRACPCLSAGSNPVGTATDLGLGRRTGGRCHIGAVLIDWGRVRVRRGRVGAWLTLRWAGRWCR
ncbi:transposase [Streptomyces sp. NPDC127117]|uniref:transposase n=1 Tax=Streptomyces sp. NPDC127117 TaxID=3345368 RepID=UPI00362CD4AB